MRLFVTLLILIPGLCGTSFAQTGELHVVDAVTSRAISDVIVSTRDAGKSYQTDSRGFARVIGSRAPYLLSHVGYKSLRVDASPDSGVIIVRLQPAAIMLEEVEVLLPVSRFKREAEFNRQFFRKELAGAKFKPGKKLYVYSGTPMGLIIGIEWSGVFAECALRASGKKGRYRRFARVMRSMEAHKLSAIRYNTTLVSEQTGLDETAAMGFIASNELSEDYLRNATDLELKMRIREMFRGQAFLQKR